MTTRSTPRIALLGIALGMIFISGVAPAHGNPPQGTFVTFDAPGGGVDLIPNGITPAGTITGTYSLLITDIFVDFGFLRTPDGRVTTIAVPGATATSVGSQFLFFAFPGPAINPAGAIVGSYLDGSTNTFRGFLRARDGTFATFDAPGAVTGTGACCITPAGAMSGVYFDANGVGHGFLRAPDGTFTAFDAPGAVNGTQPDGINPEGVISGVYFDTNFFGHGFLRARDGFITTFDAPGAVRGTQANGINPAGAITGSYNDASGVPHGFLRDPDGTFTTFDAPGSGRGGTTPVAISPSGEIAGDFGDNMFHGFLRARDGTFTTIHPPGSLRTSVLGMNAAGAITGLYFDANDVQHGFLFLPRP